MLEDKSWNEFAGKASGSHRCANKADVEEPSSEGDTAKESFEESNNFLFGSWRSLIRNKVGYKNSATFGKTLNKPCPSKKQFDKIYKKFIR